jgi:signal peptidase I
MNPISTMPAQLDEATVSIPGTTVAYPADPAGVAAGAQLSPEVPAMGLSRAIVHDARHGLPEALASLMRTIIIALFVLTFVAQPMVIPSESMEHTLLVGDFLLVNRTTLAPGGIWKRILPYAEVARGEIVTFHSPLDRREYLVKRVIGLPGDRLRIDHDLVTVNGVPLEEPYATFEPTAANPYLDHFPTQVYSDPAVEPDWWKQMQQLTQGGELVIPAGKFFMLGDNRNHSRDSRYWGFVSRNQIIARPLVIYFSLARPSRYDVQTTVEASNAQAPNAQAPNDRLGHDSDLSAHLRGFARWRRIFHVVH